MHDDGFECQVVSHRQVVGVEYASAPVVFGVHQHDNVFVWRSREPVVEVFQVECRQVSVAVEGVEVGVQCGVFHIPLPGSDVPLSSDVALTATMLNLLLIDLNGSCAKRASIAVRQSSMNTGISLSVYPSATYAMWMQRVVSAACWSVS